MNVLFTAKFNKDISKLTDDDLLERIALVIEDLENAQSLSNVSNVKKMKGYSGYFRIRIGDYRLGIYVEKNDIYIQRLAHRKNIYDIFP
jgi:mRNA interferase RelE/StbE